MKVDFSSFIPVDGSDKEIQMAVNCFSAGYDAGAQWMGEIFDRALSYLPEQEQKRLLRVFKRATQEQEKMARNDMLKE